MREHRGRCGLSIVVVVDVGLEIGCDELCCFLIILRLWIFVVEIVGGSLKELL
jgi:hypothetical protein